MNMKSAKKVAEYAWELVEGSHAVDPLPSDVEGGLAESLGRICATDGTTIQTAGDLRTVLTAAYHLGRRHALERVAIGLSQDTGLEPDAELIAECGARELARRVATESQHTGRVNR